MQPDERLAQLRELQKLRKLTAAEWLDVATLLARRGDHEQAKKAFRKRDRLLAAERASRRDPAPEEDCQIIWDEVPVRRQPAPPPPAPPAAPPVVIHQSSSANCGAAIGGCFAGGCLLLVLLVVLGGGVFSAAMDEYAESYNSSSSSSSGGGTDGDRFKPSLKVIEWSWVTDRGYATATGRVTNISGRTLEFAKVQVSYYSDDGTYLTSDDSYLSATELLPGETTSFEVMSTVDDRYSRAQLAFEAGGRVLYAKSADD